MIILVDVRRGIEAEEQELLNFLSHIGQQGLVVATKIDRLPVSKRKPALLALQKESGVRALGFSSVTGEGRDGLWRAIGNMCAITPTAKLVPPELAQAQDMASREVSGESAASRAAAAPKRPLSKTAARRKAAHKAAASKRA